MEDFRSNYTGEQIEDFLDQLYDLALENYALKADVDTAIANAITNTLNTPV